MIDAAQSQRYPTSGDGRHTLDMRNSVALARGSNVDTSVAMNGSVKLGGAAMARAAENIAQWKTYLPEDCVKSMMNHGWHWST